MKSFIISAVISTFLLNCCTGQSQKVKIIDNYFSGNLTDTCNIYLEVQKIGKEVIPILIEYIDYDRKAEVGFHNPYSSTIDELLYKNYKGIDAAYLIEFLLAKDTIENKEIKYEGTQQINPFNIYGYGVIVKQNKSELIKKPLTYNDMKEIKQIYKSWWGNNEKKSISQLREEWQQNKSILKDSNFSWL